MEGMDRGTQRVFGAFGATTMASALLGQILASTTGDHVGLVPWYMSWGIMYLIAGVIALVTVRGIMLKKRVESQTPSGVV
jgi:MFS family permease